MKTIQLDERGSPEIRATANRRWRRDRFFFTGTAAASIVTIFIGFAPTYYLKLLYSTPDLPTLVHAHGILFTAWIALLAAQTSLVAAKRTGLHRRIGVFGAILAALMMVVGFATAVSAVRRGRMDLGFLAVPMGTMIVFPVLVGSALIMTRKPEAHKRLMLVGTTELLTAAVGRWPFVRSWGALGSYVVTDLFLVALVAYDLLTRRRIHPVTLWGSLFLIASQYLREALRNTETWIAVAQWLTS